MDDTTVTSDSAPLPALTLPNTSASSIPDLSIPFDLSTRGQWHALFSHLSHPSHSHAPPDHRLLLSSLSALSLYKLRRFSDLPDLLPTPSVSSTPFALRHLHALLPSRLNRRPESLDRLYSLLHLCRSHPGPTWRHREIFITSALISDHFANKEYDICLDLILSLLDANPEDCSLLTKLGYIQLQIGDLNSAQSTFRRVESIGGADENLIARNKAVEFIVVKDYASAIREYDNCIERDPADAVAINNKAVCLMYSRDLGDAVKVLEGALERVPTTALSETLVVNLCSMYELAYVNHGEVKRSLAGWIAQVAPDDFDTSCTRM